MNTDSYDERIRSRIEKMFTLLPGQGQEVFAVLDSLEKDALRLEDAALTGYVYLNRAHAHYYRTQHEEMVEYLLRAVRYLLRSDSNIELARTYNLFAVEAQRVGAFDIAYHYFLMASSFVAEEKDSLSAAIITANTGDLLAEIGEYKKACPYIDSAVKVIERYHEESLDIQNRYVVQINLALYRLYAGNVASARRLSKQIEKRLAELNDDNCRAALWYLIFRMHFALQEGTEEEIAPLFTEITDRIIRTDAFTMFTKDLTRLCRDFIAHGRTKEAERLMKEIEGIDTAEASAYSRLLHAELKVDYYKATKNRRRLNAAYAVRHELYREQHEEQRKAYRNSTRFMRLVHELRLEQEEAKEENTRLQRSADTDELTHLPNRNALNRRLEEAFERAYRTGHRFGIGIIDIDSFKSYNDRFGHLQGDACLCEVADTLQRIAGKEGLFVARYGGDEFMILYEEMGVEAIEDFAKRLIGEIPVPVSHGYYSAVPSAGLRLWDFFAQADARMYKIKREKK